MTAWLAPVAEALNRAERPVTFWFRDDDAGWQDEMLLTMLDRFEQHGIFIDLAVIPLAITSHSASILVERSSRGAIGLHQHGFAHVNHQIDGRGCEFGNARTRNQQADDIAAGQRRLSELFGSGVMQPVFTPPWNRCTVDTGLALRDLGFTVLSRDTTAAPLAVDGLVEVPVTLDWFAKRKGVPLGLEDLAVRAAGQVTRDQRCGVMLHHAVTDAENLVRIEELLHLVATHPNARSARLLDLASHRSCDPSA